MNQGFQALTDAHTVGHSHCPCKSLPIPANTLSFQSPWGKQNPSHYWTALRFVLSQICRNCREFRPARHVWNAFCCPLRLVPLNIFVCFIHTSQCSNMKNVSYTVFRLQSWAFNVGGSSDLLSHVGTLKRGEKETILRKPWSMQLHSESKQIIQLLLGADFIHNSSWQFWLLRCLHFVLHCLHLELALSLLLRKCRKRSMLLLSHRFAMTLEADVFTYLKPGVSLTRKELKSTNLAANKKSDPLYPCASDLEELREE